MYLCLCNSEGEIRTGAALDAWPHFRVKVEQGDLLCQNLLRFGCDGRVGWVSSGQRVSSEDPCILGKRNWAGKDGRARIHNRVRSVICVKNPIVSAKFGKEGHVEFPRCELILERLPINEILLANIGVVLDVLHVDYVLAQEKVGSQRVLSCDTVARFEGYIVGAIHFVPDAKVAWRVKIGHELSSRALIPLHPHCEIGNEEQRSGKAHYHYRQIVVSNTFTLHFCFFGWTLLLCSFLV